MSAGGAQHVGHGHQHAIALGMTESVVDTLEEIHIKHQQREARAAPRRIAQQPFDLLLECAPIEEVGKTIAAGMDFQLFVQCL